MAKKSSCAPIFIPKHFNCPHVIDTSGIDDSIDALRYGLDFGKVGGDCTVSAIGLQELKCKHPHLWSKLRKCGSKICQEFTPEGILIIYDYARSHSEHNKDAAMIERIFAGEWLGDKYFTLVTRMHLINSRIINEEEAIMSQKVKYTGKTVKIRFLNDAEESNGGNQHYRLTEDAKLGDIVIVKTVHGYALGMVVKVSDFDGELYEHQNVLQVVKGVDEFDEAS